MDKSQLPTEGSPDSALPGQLDRWGPFERLQRVGRGAFGEVYRAFDPTLQRQVALKLLLPRGLDQDAEARSLLKEARAMARIRHPNVVPIYGVDQHHGRVGFWSDFVQGQTLSDILATQGPMGPREAALVGIDVSRAVGAGHAAWFIHRDIKAGNVMRETGGRILLMDFGLTYEGGSDHNRSGTPAYMAPELLAGQPAAIASDVYAIGVLLFHLLTARYPVEGADLERLRAAHDSGARRTLLDVRPDLPQALAHVVETAIRTDPQKRFGSAGQLVAALSDAIGMGSVTLAGPPPVKRRVFRTWMLVPAAAVAAALLLAFPQVRSVLAPRPLTRATNGGAQDDYGRARDLLAHYYRPQALETAIPLLEKVVARDTHLAPAFADLARANFLQFTQQRETKYIEPAREAALRALALAPDLASAHATLGALYAWTAQNDLASHELEEALRLDRFNAAAYAALADLYKRQGRTELVEPTLQKGISLAPDDWSLMQQLGEYYLDNGKWAQAGEQYRRAVELMPDNPRPHNNLGLVYQGLGRLEESAAAFRRAIDLEPTFIRFRNLGMVLAEAGKYEEASRMLERSIEMRPDNYRAWGLLASVYRSQRRDPAKVRETFQKAIALATDLRKETPRDEYLLADVGGYYAALGMEKESLPLLAQAAALAPAVPQVLYQVAVGYEDLRRREEALRWLASARASGYPSESIKRDPRLAALRADPRYGATVGGTR
jgi:tetratricopeptide (TPR) repeat protein/tRNA A-37 threonylcarbamoyl transferase component Bud32